MCYDKPLPKVNADNKPFWDGCKAHQLRFQKCRDCGLVRWPASLICPQCHSQNTDWITSAGKGKLYSYVIYRVAYHPGFEDDLPYVVGIVELEEGLHLLTNIIGCNLEEMVCDMRVEVTWDDITENFSLPKFQPALLNS
jgi:uncharacterized OB-fold protein